MSPLHPPSSGQILNFPSSTTSAHFFYILSQMSPPKTLSVWQNKLSKTNFRRTGFPPRSICFAQSLALFSRLIRPPLTDLPRLHLSSLVTNYVATDLISDFCLSEDPSPERKVREQPSVCVILGFVGIFLIPATVKEELTDAYTCFAEKK